MSNASGYLGIAQRARKISSGEMLFKKFSRNEIKLVILADDIGENTKKKLLDKCAYYKIPFIFMDTKELADVMGNRKAIGIMDNGLAQQLYTCLKG